ncbi:MAG: hypothetical protein V4864_23820 [Pseudomonadota bacterium]
MPYSRKRTKAPKDDVEREREAMAELHARDLSNECTPVHEPIVQGDDRYADDYGNRPGDVPGHPAENGAELEDADPGFIPPNGVDPDEFRTRHGDAPPLGDENDPRLGLSD